MSYKSDTKLATNFAQLKNSHLRKNNDELNEARLQDGTSEQKKTENVKEKREKEKEERDKRADNCGRIKVQRDETRKGAKNGGRENERNDFKLK